MMKSTLFTLLIALGLLMPWSALAQDQDMLLGPEGDEAPLAEEESDSTEAICDDGLDNDGDALTDCSDSDCFLAGHCDSRSVDETTDERCSDWIDNDGDGAIDCDDSSCEGVPWCRGSFAGEFHGHHEEEPVLAEGQSTVDFVGQAGDIAGERNDYLCADGIDNDGDGRTDCQDFGCRYDPSVRVCQGPRNFVFSVVAGVGATFDIQGQIDGRELAENFDVNFTRLQLRVLGEIPYIENSFFLLSMRMEKSPRLTFANFQVPVGDRGLVFGINSGGATLSTGLVISAAKNPLLDPAFYMFSAFEQGNGAAVELSGPIDDEARFRFRLFAAGGSGEFNGNVGGRFFRDEDRNVTWGAGGALQYNAIGFFDRFDSRLAYLEMPLTLSFMLGAKYDQRADERYPAGNFLAIFTWNRLLLQLETNFKYELDFESFQVAYNALLEVILIPRRLVFAADAGQFIADDFNGAADGLAAPLDEFQWRTALHWFWFRDRGLATLLYTERHIDENPERPEDPTLERQLRLELQYRF